MVAALSFSSPAKRVTYKIAVMDREPGYDGAVGGEVKDQNAIAVALKCITLKRDVLHE